MAQKKYSAAVLLSGGPDSATLTAWALAKDMALTALTFDFGDESSEREIRVARTVARYYGLGHRILDLSGLRRTLRLEPEVAFMTHTGRPLAPFSVGVVLSAAAMLALQEGHDGILFGVHHDDEQEGPQYRPEVVKQLERAVREAGGCVDIEAPFSAMAKGEVFLLGKDLAVPFELTWSCRTSSEMHCGSCAGCLARISAFRVAGIADVTSYSTSAAGEDCNAGAHDATSLTAPTARTARNRGTVSGVTTAGRRTLDA